MKKIICSLVVLFLAGFVFAGSPIVLSDSLQPIQSALSTVESNVSSISNSVNTLTERVDEITDEKWCYWDGNVLSETATNWIPTNTWPAKCVNLYILQPNSYTNLAIGIRSNWVPEKELKLNILWAKSSNAQFQSPKLYLGNWSTGIGANSTITKLEIRWVPILERWLIYRTTVAYQNSSLTVEGSQSFTTWSKDTFLPELDEDEEEPIEETE